MVNIPNDHFGPIPAEADPRGQVRSSSAPFNGGCWLDAGTNLCMRCRVGVHILLLSTPTPPLLLSSPHTQGIRVGEWWKDRLDCRQWGAHFPHVAGIAGQSNMGAQSVVLSGG